MTAVMSSRPSLRASDTFRLFVHKVFLTKLTTKKLDSPHLQDRLNDEELL